MRDTNDRRPTELQPPRDLLRVLPGAMLLLLLLLASPGARAAEGLTLEKALELARRQAPAVATIRAEVEEARARLRGAEVLLESNPVIEVESGPRWGPGGRSLDLGVGWMQDLELGRRGARVRSATSGFAGAQASAEVAIQEHLRETAVAFLQALHAERSLGLSIVSASLAEALVRITTEGRGTEAPNELDVHRARMDLARAQSDVHAARVLREQALASLRVLLGLPFDADLAVTGTLETGRREDLDVLLERAMRNPELVALEALGQAADAERRLAEMHRWPGLGLGVSFTSEADERFAHASLALTLPVFNHGQGPRAEAIARANRLRAELQARRRAVAIRVHSAFVVLGLCLDAVETFEDEILDALVGLPERTQRSYRAGELSLTDVLTLRREVLDTRRSHLDRQLEAAIAAVELEAASGGLR